MVLDEVDDELKKMIEELKRTKKKKKRVNIDFENSNSTNTSNTSKSSVDVCEDVGEDLFDQYKKLLHRFYEEKNKNKVVTTLRRTFENVSSEVLNGKTYWKNFSKNSVDIGRDQQFILNYFRSELQRPISISSMGMLVISGKYKTSQLETLFNRFKNEYVKCHVCNSVNTHILKNVVSRLIYVKCNKCTSERYVMKIDLVKVK